MSKKMIELEIRGEIRPTEIPRLTKRLVGMGFAVTSVTRRTSVMSFGTVGVHGQRNERLNGNNVDVRCRITNGRAEVVAKVGLTSAANRVEVGVPVALNDMLRFARLFGAIPFFTKVGSKTTTNLERGNVIVSLVKSPSGLAYVEIEKMTDAKHEKADLAELNAVAKDLGVNLWKTHAQFIAFCDRLTRQDDWIFHGTEKDIKRLREEIRKMGSDRKR